MRRHDAQLVFGCTSVLLSYPEDSFTEDLSAVSGALGRLPRCRVRGRLVGAVAWLSARSPMEAATRYVETFDLTRRRTLHLTYYRHGDTRERGLALAALAGAYRDAGLQLRPGELPDLLPALLELAALSTTGSAVLAEHRGALEALRVELEEFDSPYTEVVAAVSDALGPASRADRTALRRYRAEGPPSERVGLEPFIPPEVLADGLRAQ
jgi:nitrate reductase molybdenum cofactor assembly chaperone NarJ/NarW